MGSKAKYVIIDNLGVQAMTLVNELTVEELIELLKHEMQDVVRAAVRDVMAETENHKQDQMAILDIPSLDVGEWPAGLSLLGREEIYGDDGR
jgi:hypothetical protein